MNEPRDYTSLYNMIVDLKSRVTEIQIEIKSIVSILLGDGRGIMGICAQVTSNTKFLEQLAKQKSTRFDTWVNRTFSIVQALLMLLVATFLAKIKWQ